MKKLTTIIAIALFISSSAFAYSGDRVSEERVADAVKVAFKKNFSNAVHTSWEKSSDFYFASFGLGNYEVMAAYNENGELLGTSRRIDLGQIPLSVSWALMENYSQYRIGIFATEIVFEGQTFYLVHAEGDSRKLELKCLTSGDIYVEKKIRK